MDRLPPPSGSFGPERPTPNYAVKSIATLAAIALLIGTFAAGVVVGRNAQESRTVRGGAGPEVIEEAYRRILETSIDPPSERQLTRGAVRGMMRVLRKLNDDYASFFTPRTYESLQEITTGEFSGIGVWLEPAGKKGLQVQSVLPRTPAQEAGMKHGDLIRAVDGRRTREMTVDEAVNSIKGPEGTLVTLDIERDGRDIVVTLRRKRLTLPNVTSKLVEGDIAYVRLFGFANGASAQLNSHITRLMDRGATGLVLDLRDNPGGLFDEAVDVASMFIEDGPIVIYRERGVGREKFNARGDAFDIPLIVLVNGGSASASEIVAGALQDTKRAQLVGTRTFGKGQVQQVIRLQDDSVLKFTTAEYLTARGRSIDRRGIRPDVVVDASAAAQKRRAVGLLRSILVSSAGGQG